MNLRWTVVMISCLCQLCIIIMRLEGNGVGRRAFCFLLSLLSGLLLLLRDALGDRAGTGGEGCCLLMLL
ncbi:hypothetical protein V8F33_007032 [Rhypophila sp. PSN 637]